MAVSRRFAVRMADVFPAGALLVGGVEPVLDFNAGKRPDGSLPQQVDKDTGLLVWSVQVLDPDPLARKTEKTVSVKLFAAHQPVPPAAVTPEMPVVPVVFEDLSLVPWIDTNGTRPKLAWSIRAASMSAPGAPSRKQAA